MRYSEIQSSTHLAQTPKARKHPTTYHNTYQSPDATQQVHSSGVKKLLPPAVKAQAPGPATGLSPVEQQAIAPLTASYHLCLCLLSYPRINHCQQLIKRHKRQPRSSSMEALGGSLLEPEEGLRLQLQFLHTLVSQVSLSRSGSSTEHRL